MKLPGRDLVAEALAGLGDAERRLLARGLHDVEEVDEDALGRLGPQVVQARLVLDDAEVGLEHHVELARLGPLPAGAAVRAGDVGQGDRVGVDLLALLRLPVGDGLLQVVDAEALVAAEALGERVGELADVARGDPRLARQDDRGVEADDVLAGGHHRAPPLALDVLLELDAERAVVPRRARAAVDLTAREDEPAALAEGDDGVDDGGGGGHARKAIRAGTLRPNRLRARTRARRAPRAGPGTRRTALACRHDVGPRAAGPRLLHVSTLRESFERASLPALTFLSRLPRVVPFLVMLGLVVAGALLPGWGMGPHRAGRRAPRVDPAPGLATADAAERLMRTAVVAILLAVTVTQVVPRG